MDRFHRYYRFHRILSSRSAPVPRLVLEQELECSRASVMRIVEELRSCDAPIEYVRKQNGYRYTPGVAFELPGIWFSPSELEALFVADHLLEQAEPGLLAETLAPLKQKLGAIFRQEHLGRGELVRRVRILRMAGRGPGKFLNTAADALTRRRRLAVSYHSRSRDETGSREVSPQRLVHYRDNWYLDVWDHGKRALRMLSVDRIREARVLNRLAKNVDETRLDAHFTRSYGIFAGNPRHRARLRFTAERARWVSGEAWHPEQQSHFDDQGRYVLEIPYSDARELSMDVLKYGPDVEVLAPPSLRKLVRDRLAQAVARYGDPGAKDRP